MPNPDSRDPAHRPLDHSGGAIPAGMAKIPVEWNETGQAVPIPIVHFDYGALDSLEDEIREALANGRRIAEVLSRWVCDHERQILREGIELTVREIIVAKNPRLRTWQLAFLCGMDLRVKVDGPPLDGPAIAKRLGVSKQSFFGGVEELRQQYDVMRVGKRDDEAREKMRQRNYRRKTK